MKLYTEEQVRKAYYKGASDCHDKCIKRNWRGVELKVSIEELKNLCDEYIQSSNPIELPSDEEIERIEQLEVLAKVLAKTWYYGDWKWETPNERVMQMMMERLGYYPFDGEDEMIKHTHIDDELYEQATREVKHK